MTALRGFYEVPIEDAATPRDGDVRTDAWWAVSPGGGILFALWGGKVEGRHRYSSAQCNSDRAVIEHLIPKLYPDATAVHLPVVFRGYDGICGHHEAAGLPAHVPQEY